MASQPTFAPYTPRPVTTPKPNIRIAYIAGDAVTAIHRGMSTKPATTRESTLEELAIAGLTDELIAAAAELLSPAMYAAFLQWGEAASYFVTHYDTDKEGLARCDVNTNAVRAIASLSAANMHDVALKAHLLNIEAGDCPDFGPTNGQEADGRKLPFLIDSVSSDLRDLSPVVGLLEELAQLAWSASGPRAMSLTVEIGAIITRAFSAARGALSLDLPDQPPLPAQLEGYSPFMRGPLVAWRKAYAVYEAATTEFTTFDRTTFDPICKRYLALTNQRQERTGDVEFDAALAATGDEMDAAQERFDALLEAQQYAIEALYRVPAPGPSELATKLKIFDRQSGWELNDVGATIGRFTSDARRFGKHGAFIQADRNVLTAYAGCRTEMEGAKITNDLTDAEEEAYWERLGAHEEVLTETPAMTIEGVLAKLRVAFSRTNESAWSDHAVMNPNVSEFRKGLHVSGMFDRMAWSAIEDLARIGGINLAEQRA